MIDHFFHLRLDASRGLQEQLKDSLVSAILGGYFEVREPLPSRRKLADQLSISRNTVSLVYDDLLANGYLVSRPRKGYFLHDDYANLSHHAPQKEIHPITQQGKTPFDWTSRFRTRPVAKHDIILPGSREDFIYPFVHGQPEKDKFPLEQWREASRSSLRRDKTADWICDRFDKDDETLIQQLRSRVLPKRGIWARPDEILITMGSQNALYLIATLLMDSTTRLLFENPGYREAYHVFSLLGATINLQNVDEQGLSLTEAGPSHYVYVTPSHQVPTGVTMTQSRRADLLDYARQHDSVVIEDDYDAEINIDSQAIPSLKSNDDRGSVIYVGSLSKFFCPGLRMGYIVASRELVAELRALRRLMYRHPPFNNQRMLAEFLSQGYYDAHLRRFREQHARRHDLMIAAIGRDMPGCKLSGSAGANALWVMAPGVDTKKLAWEAAKRSVLIEYGAQFFQDERNASLNFMRLGMHAIPAERIDTGISLLARALDH